MARVVMFAFLDPSLDTRVRREARALIAAGHRVSVIGRRTGIGPAEARWETRDGIPMLLVATPGPWQEAAAYIRYPWRARGRIAAAAVSALARGRAGIPDLLTTVARGAIALAWSMVRLPLYLAFERRRVRPATESPLDWLVRWRMVVLGWAAASAAAAPEADVWHAHDLPGLAAAVRTHQRHGGLIVYDVRDLYSEAGSMALQPSWVRRLLRRTERRWAGRAVAVVTVNERLGAALRTIVGPIPTVIVGNCPPRWTEPAHPRDRLRESCGIPSIAPVVLYHGRFGPNRGLANLAAAMLRHELRSAHLVFMGSGPVRPDLDALAADVAYGGRLHVIDAVAPEDLMEWVATADVGVATNLPVCLNERLSSPNKLFECLAAGVPVVSSDFPIRRRILLDDPVGPLGELCDPLDDGDIAAAIARILGLEPGERAALRARCMTAARERWNWETESARLVALYASVAGDASVGDRHQRATPRGST